MNQFDLSSYLSLNSSISSNGICKLHEVTSHFYTPGFWAAIASLLRSRSIAFDKIQFTGGQARQHAKIIGLPSILGINSYYRRNAIADKGRGCSGLTLFENKKTADAATQTINECIEVQCAGLGLDNFARQLCNVVEGLHDNVWSHGKSTGISMFQSWKNPYFSEDVLLEFGLADSGLGFLRELKRIGFDDVGNHQSAIDWCIRKGHSSKLPAARYIGRPEKLPLDAMGVSSAQGGNVRGGQIFHQGLGLAKLISLIEHFHGELCLCTGDSILTIDRAGVSRFSSLEFPWSGVAISCRFDASLIRSSYSKAA